MESILEMTRRGRLLKSFAAVFACFCFCALLAPVSAKTPAPAVAGVQISWPTSYGEDDDAAKPEPQMPLGAIGRGRDFNVSFPRAMVPTADLGVAGKPSPLCMQPELPGKWVWKSQTEGVYTVGGKVIPNQKFQLFLTKGLADLKGVPLQAEKPVGRGVSRPFIVEDSYFIKGGKQPLRPYIVLRFSYPVSPASVAQGTFFQDRDNRHRYPVDVVVLGKNRDGYYEGEENSEREEVGTDLNAITRVKVVAREDLPKGRTFDLIVEGALEPNTGYRMPDPFVKPLGITEPLRVECVVAANRAMEKPSIEIAFNDEMDPAQGSKIRIEPAVNGVKWSCNEKKLIGEGPFDVHQRYKVFIPADVMGLRGYPMQAESRWGATFHLKPTTIVFPHRDSSERSRLGFRFPFYQVNTGPLHWRLAQVPPEKLPALQERLKEFTENAKDPITGKQVIDKVTDIPVWKPTELLIEANHLDVLAQGEMAASPEDANTRREIAWSPGEKLPAGPCVLEVTGTDAEGHVIGNRSLISFTETDVLQKQLDGAFELRVTHFGDGRPLSGVNVRAVNAKNHWRAEAATDKDGVVRFASEDLFPKNNYQEHARWFLLETPEGLMFQSVRGQQYSAEGSWSGRSEEPGMIRTALVTDRPLYRPGHTVKFKGFLREISKDGGRLGIPKEGKVEWSITRSRADDDESSREALVSGTTALDEFGGFEGEWLIPKTIGLRHYMLGVKMPGKKGEAGAEINVQEFRPPPFTVALSDLKQTGDVSGIRIKSMYFHGAPNNGAVVKWQAVWSRWQSEKARTAGDSCFVETEPPQIVKVQESEKKVTGEGKLGPDGTLELKLKPPFTDAALRGWYRVEWTVSVMGSDGQTITEPAVYPVYSVPVALSISGEEKPGPEKAVVLDADAFSPEETPVPGTPLQADVYHVVNKSVKEEIAPHVYRYRNSTLYAKEATLKAVTPWKETVPVKEAGEYIVVIRHAENGAVPTEFCRVSVSGNREDRPAEFAQNSDEKFEVKCDKKRYAPGETAVLSVQAPYAGAAWVSVEAEGKVLDAFAQQMDSNAGRVEIPIKKEYFPNAWVCVYLMRPGGEDRIPAERMGSVKLAVTRPDLDLQVEPTLASKQARPGEEITGSVGVNCEGKPTIGADVTVYAVDEAMLVAGGWAEPKLLEMLYPPRNWAVQSFFSQLQGLGTKYDDCNFTQKGFILGDGSEGGALGPKKAARKEFLPLAFWKTGLRTGPDGKVPYSFKAPDSLTRYRVIALVQTRENQFGLGSDAVEVSKPVQIEPAMPRFVRVGDAVELRAIVRQKIADSLPVTLRCSTGLKLEGDTSLTQAVKRNEPAVFRFRATAGDTESASVRWETDAGPGDAVEMTIPVHPPTLLRKEAVFGTLGQSDPLADLHRLVPARWEQSVGKADVTLSTSPWLPKLTGLPLLLEYPHGCFEQISSRVLGYTVLGDLLAYLPDGGVHDHEYRLRVDDGLQRMNGALLDGGYLPYWPGGRPSWFPTIAGYWAARSAKANGWEVPPRLLTLLPKGVREIAEGKNEAVNVPLMRCFALMVLAEEGKEVAHFEPIVRDLYQRRETYDEESRAFLALAMHRFGIMPKEKEQLLHEIDRPLKATGFDPDTFSSTTRTEAIRALAFATIHPETNDGKARKELKNRIEEMLDSARSLSTQENFWLLMAFNAMHAPEQAAKVDFAAANPAPAALSANKASALWPAQDIRKVGEFSPVIGGSDAKKAPLAGLSCLVDAQFRMESADQELDNRTDRGFRVERVIRNLTDPARTGDAASPWHLGDQIQITIRLNCPKEQHYVAVEGELPACLETLNPSLPSVARSYSVPLQTGDTLLDLSYSELRDKMTCLYFNHVAPGVAVYSVLARVTSAGTFRWPATQAVPMYDARFSGVSAASVVNAVGE